MTSVKEIHVETPATDGALGRGSFVFTDAYSVFDWGQMPDPIPQKGASLCAMGAGNFELLESAGVPTHYRGVVDPGSGDGAIVDLADLDGSEPPREMAIELAAVPALPHDGRDYDYDAYHAAAGSNYLVPLEVVFRNTVPVGSSLRRRTEPADHGLDYDDWPEEAVDLHEPIVEFTTKLEESDRHLDLAEADRIAGPDVSVDDLDAVAREVNRLVTERAAEADLVHEDGKIECIAVSGEVRVADVVGTFDENRFSYDGQEVSKEVIRQYHKRTQPEWVEAVAAAKAEAKRRDVADWKSLCELAPEPLPAEVVQVASDLYAGGANAYLDRSLFDAPSLAEAVEAVRAL
ncbi:MAG TPA: phosphoribosylaminoimidazolesuccinocarboxamide synthase [Halobacteriales archaeon]|nr:phosphoribosylaminoimidazolesuccinocarboxamide synthase [Halobacteriales archaeon]